jgi:HEAT repeat protein
MSEVATGLILFSYASFTPLAGRVATNCEWAKPRRRFQFRLRTLLLLVIASAPAIWVAKFALIRWQLDYYSTHAARLGPEAIPLLISELRSGSPYRSSTAAYTLSCMKGNAATALPALISMLENSELQSDIISILGHIGPAAVPALVDALSHPNAGVRTDAARAFRFMEPEEAAPALTTLAAALHDSSPNVRAAAALTLGHLGPTAETALPELLAALDDSDRWVRIEVVRSLGRMGQPAQPAIDRLMEFVKSNQQDDLLRSSAIQSLAEIGVDDARVVAALADAMARGNRYYRVEAINAMALLGKGSNTVHRALLDAIHDDDHFVGIGAIRALGTMGPVAAPAIPELVVAIRNPHADVREAAALALSQIGPEAPEALCELRCVLNDHHPGVRRNAESAIARRTFADP